MSHSFFKDQQDKSGRGDKQFPVVLEAANGAI